MGKRFGPKNQLMILKGDIDSDHRIYLEKRHPFESILPGKLSLRIGEVHLWSARFSDLTSSVTGAENLLSGDERERAGKFSSRKYRDAFILSRWLVRSILGGYLGQKPENVRFCYGANGKPSVEGEREETGLSFNLSHSEGIVLIAVARGIRVGIDVEFMKPDVSCREIIEKLFYTAEVSALLSIPERERIVGFYTCWTRKEAFTKAVGAGMSMPLSSFEISLPPDDPPRILSIEGDSRESSKWIVQDIIVDPGYKAAIVFEEYRAQIFKEQKRQKKSLWL